MKIIAKILLFLFVAFLLTPTVVRLIEKDTDTALFNSFPEEETVKQIKLFCNLDTTFELSPVFNSGSGLILFENLSKHDNVDSAIIIPPPDQV